MDNFKKAVDYLLYKGPTINELILEVGKKDVQHNVINIEDGKLLEVKSKTSYELEIVDKYWFNIHGELYRKTIIMRNKEKVIFDKFSETKALLKLDEINYCMIS